MSTSATGYQRSKAAISVMLLRMKLGGQRPHLRLRDPDLHGALTIRVKYVMRRSLLLERTILSCPAWLSFPTSPNVMEFPHLCDHKQPSLPSHLLIVFISVIYCTFRTSPTCDPVPTGHQPHLTSKPVLSTYNINYTYHIIFFINIIYTDIISTFAHL